MVCSSGLNGTEFENVLLDELVISMQQYINRYEQSCNKYIYVHSIYIYIFLIQSIYIRTYSSLHSNNLCKVVSC